MAVLQLTKEQIYQLAAQLPPEEKQELIAKLATAPNPVPVKRVPGRYKGKIWVSPDFNDPLPDDIQALFE